MTREHDPHGNTAAAGLVLSTGTGAAVSLPSDFALATAQFERDGLDLVVVAKTGTRVVVKGYFAGATPPDLAVAGGPVIAGDTVAGMADGDGPYWGRLHSLQGGVDIVDMGGNVSAATPGRPLLPGE
ncbi:MAG: hypothetical protein VW338_15615, partial [Rhodospirillaceae bacterium]